ncbi:hypothetical protein [Mycobacterium malmoense]|uniref:hypothetical protein n=1 Tax=Mycobacterium malmoense TaxID=1780 RepID=UPI00111BF240|nr:hypothetical protein [Mycobacterium malmoense]UNB95207.1 hypothetical protein H5T25_04330 [Mycobacterium malmoense]
MDLAARPYISASVALVGAAVIAAGPMTQHLPGFHVAQHLLPGSELAIDLAAAEDSIMDLFSGVPSGVMGGAGTIDLPTDLLGEALNPAGATGAASDIVNPIQTWIDTFSQAGTNLSTIANAWLADPFPILQQVGANLQSYGEIYTSSFHTAANILFQYVFGAQAYGFQYDLAQALHDISIGEISQGMQGFVSTMNALIEVPGPSLFPILAIPGDMTQNLTNSLNSVLGNELVLNNVLANILNVVNNPLYALGDSLQAVYDGTTSGDPLAALSNLVNIPGAMTNALVNGYEGAFTSPGLLSTDLFPYGNFGALWTALIYLPQVIATGLGADAGANGAAAATNSLAELGFGNLGSLGDLGGTFASSMLTDVAGILSADLGTMALNILSMF